MTIVGVAPREFFGLQVGSEDRTWWLPLALEPVDPSSQPYSAAGGLRLMGRLKPGDADRAGARGNGGVVPVDSRRENSGTAKILCCAS